MRTNRIIREKLGAYLLESDKSRGQLANEIGISRQTLTERLLGRTEWKWQEVLQISRITKTSLDELAGLR